MSLFGTGRKESAGAVAVLLALAVVVHAPGLFLGAPRAPLDAQQLPPAAAATPAQRALLDSEVAHNQAMLLPAMRAAGRAVDAGQVPLWNPDHRLGEPVLLSGAAPLYPPFWPLMAEDGRRWLPWILWLHAALACVTMFRFLRSMGLSRYTAFLGSGGYGMGWYLTGQLDRLPEAAAAALLPFALEATQRVTVVGTRRGFAPLLGLALMLMFATGGTTTATLGAGLCAAMLLAALRALDTIDRHHALVGFTLGAGVAALLAAPLWLFAVEHAGALVPAAGIEPNHLQLAGLLGMFGATTFGVPGVPPPAALAELNPGADPLELLLYPGALALFVLVLGLLRPKRGFASLIWVVTGGVGLLLTLDSPLFDLLASATGLQLAAPGAGLALLHVAVVVLASMSLESFFENPVQRAAATKITSAACIAVVAAATAAILVAPALGAGLRARLIPGATPDELAAAADHLGRAWLPAGITLLLISGLFLIWRRLGILRFKTALATVVLGEIVLTGLLATPRGDPASDDWSAFTDRVPDLPGRVAAADRGPLPPAGVLAAAGHRVVHTAGRGLLGRTADLLRAADPAMVRTGRRPSVRPPIFRSGIAGPVLARAGVDAGIAAAPLDVHGFTPTAAAPGGAGGTGHGLHVELRDVRLPRFRVAYRAHHAADRLEAFAALVSLDPGDRTVVLEGASDDFVPRPATRSPRIDVIEDTPNAVHVQVDLHGGRGYLVVHDAIAPGWVASVDGERQPILAADLAFRAVPLGPGRHDVRFEYRPLAWHLGLPLAGLGLLLALGLGLRSALAPRPKRRTGARFVRRR